MPALTQASSLSPPGAPETPAAPITSSPTVIGSAPRAVVKPVRYCAPICGFFFNRSSISPEGMRNVRAVKAFLKLFSMVCGPVPDLDQHLAVAADDGGRHAVAVRGAGGDGGLRDCERHSRGHILAREQLRARGRNQNTRQADRGQAIRHHRHDEFLPWWSRPR